MPTHGLTSRTTTSQVPGWGAGLSKPRTQNQLLGTPGLAPPHASQVRQLRDCGSPRGQHLAWHREVNPMTSLPTSPTPMPIPSGSRCLARLSFWGSAFAPSPASRPGSGSLLRPAARRGRGREGGGGLASASSQGPREGEGVCARGRPSSPVPAPNPSPAAWGLWSPSRPRSEARRD